MVSCNFKGGHFAAWQIVGDKVWKQGVHLTGYWRSQRGEMGLVQGPDLEGGKLEISLKSRMETTSLQGSNIPSLSRWVPWTEKLMGLGSLS